jgi:hypothetical protein
MGAGYGSVWAVDPDGAILRVDPRTQQVQQRTRVAPGAILNVGAGAVWVLEATGARSPAGRVLRIEPTSGRVTARAGLELPTVPGSPNIDMLVVGGRPWVLGSLGAVRLDPETLRPLQRIAIDPSDGEPQPMFATLREDGLWVLTRDQRIKRYDLAGGHVAEELPARLPGASVVVPTPAGPLLVTRQAEYALADPDDGRLVWRRTIGTSTPGPPAIEGDTMITHVTATGGDRAVALNVETGETEFSVPLPEFGIAGAANVGRQIWIATPAGKVMILQR